MLHVLIKLLDLRVTSGYAFLYLLKAPLSSRSSSVRYRNFRHKCKQKSITEIPDH